MNVGLLLVVIALLPTTMADAWVGAAPKIDLKTCRLIGWSEDVRCGEFEVWEDRQAKQGRTIKLRIVVIPALASPAAPDPVFYLAGGPGGSAVDTIAKAGPTFLAELRRERDLVFVDQRGTGGSNPLPLDLYGDRSTMTACFAELFALDKVREGRDALARVANLKLYTTSMAMDDLDQVRGALGYDRINLYGGSYGSRAALVYLRLHSDHVRTATLAGVAPTSARLPLPFGKGFDHAIERVCADCAADADSHAAFPDPLADLDAALARLDSGAIEVDAANPFSKRLERVTLNRGMFVDLVRVLLYQPEYTRWLPLFWSQCAAGEFGAFVSTGFQVFRSIEDSIARGMSFSVLCAEDIPFVTDEDIERDVKGLRYGDARLNAFRRVAAIWPHADVPADLHEPVVSAVPVLLLSGDADPVTPPWLAAEAASHLPNSRHLTVPHTGHFFRFPCVDNLINEFVRKGSAAELDASCLAQIRRPPFVTPDMLAAMARSTATKPPAAGDEVWRGVLDVGTGKLRIVLSISKAADGTLAGALESVDQGNLMIPIAKLTRIDAALRVDMPAIDAIYEGTLSSDGTTFKGEWRQKGHTWPLDLSRSASSGK